MRTASVTFGVFVLTASVLVGYEIIHALRMQAAFNLSDLAIGRLTTPWCMVTLVLVTATTYVLAR
jgi:hypothetical protein